MDIKNQKLHTTASFYEVIHGLVICKTYKEVEELCNELEEGPVCGWVTDWTSVYNVADEAMALGLAKDYKPNVEKDEEGRYEVWVSQVIRHDLTTEVRMLGRPGELDVEADAMGLDWDHNQLVVYHTTRRQVMKALHDCEKEVA